MRPVSHRPTYLVYFIRDFQLRNVHSVHNLFSLQQNDKHTIEHTDTSTEANNEQAFWPISTTFTQAKLIINFYKLGMHLLTYNINSFLLMMSAICHCLLITFTVNHAIHAIDEWRWRMSACVNAEGGRYECCLWLLRSKWQRLEVSVCRRLASHTQHFISHFRDDSYKSNNPTNSVKALNEAS